MPLYEYECPTCKARQQRTLPMEGRDLAAPSCQYCGRKTRRQFSKPNIVFIGGGWGGDPPKKPEE